MEAVKTFYDSTNGGETPPYRETGLNREIVPWKMYGSARDTPQGRAHEAAWSSASDRGTYSEPAPWPRMA